MTPSLAVVVPTLDEAERLPRLLGELRPLNAEVVVADGGSTDGTAGIAREAAATVVAGRRGRARQMNAGAAATDAEWLLFLHADSSLRPSAIEALTDFLAGARPDDFANFRFELDGRGAFYRAIEIGQRLRERVTGLAYGDQGLLVSRALFERAGGYPEWPILEDVGLLERLGRLGIRGVLSASLPTSPRRYDAEGGIRGWLRNVAIIVAYRVGTPPEEIARRYPRAPAEPTGGPPPGTVAVFAKAPRAGRVKTRLAADLGDEEALRIYRALGRATVDALRDGPHRLVVYYDPPDDVAAEEVKEWLDGGGLDSSPQSAGDLGARMSAAVDECLGTADRVCVVGTDIPGIDRRTVATAFEALGDADVVIGPATDGGYYLIALQSPAPDLFRDVPWSTPSVLEVTLARAAAAGLSAHLLDAKTDVDTAVDVPPGLRSA